MFRLIPGAARAHRWMIYAALESRFTAFSRGERRSRQLEKICREHLEAQVSDPELRSKLTPPYAAGCKRVLVSDDFYPALASGAAELVTAPIERIVPEGVLCADGETREVDTIVLATGFDPFALASQLEVVGPGGLRLADAWKGGIEAHRTVAIPGFPNFFMLLGPNSGLGHNSMIFMIEAQVRYVLRCLQAMESRNLAQLEAAPQACAAFNRWVQRAMAKTVWQGGGCHSWYQDDAGRIFTLWPGTTLRYWWEMRRPKLREFLQVPRTAAASRRPGRGQS